MAKNKKEWKDFSKAGQHIIETTASGVVFSQAVIEEKRYQIAELENLKTSAQERVALAQAEVDKIRVLLGEIEPPPEFEPVPPEIPS